MATISFGGNNHGLQIGDSRGPINVEFHLPPSELEQPAQGQVRLTNRRFPTLEQPETPPSPLSTVPFTRDPDFVRRNTLLDHIHEKSSVPGSRIGLVGLGGVG
jgi:hypothetical protein